MCWTRKKRSFMSSSRIQKNLPEIVEKIVLGKLNKFYEEICLVDQKYIKDDKLSIKEYVASFIAKFGENIRVRRFARFQLGGS